MRKQEQVKNYPTSSHFYQPSTDLGKVMSHLATVKEFAKTLEFDPCSITSWENGEHQLQSSTMRKLRAILTDLKKLLKTCYIDILT